jgi:Cu2+-exporting ATPase
VAKTLSALQQRGWKLAILSGDDSPQVQSLGLELQKSGIGLEECLGGLSPEQKKDYLDRFHALGLTTVMIGDGINDAIALASADVGIAVRGPSEIALRNAPIYMGANHLELIPRLLDASTNAVKAIHRCFAASLFYNCITIGLAATGYIHPWIAAVFMPISGITVLLMAWTARTFPPHSKSLTQTTFE